MRADLAHRAFVDRARRARRAAAGEHARRLARRVDADAVVVTAGPWVTEFFPDLPVRTTRETVAYFRRDGEPLPSVVQLDPVTRGHALYSLHDPVHGLKAGAHHAGAGSRRTSEGDPDPALVDRIAEWVARTYPDADPRAGRRRDVHVHDDGRRALHPRAPRPGRDRLALQRPRLQVRARDWNAAGPDGRSISSSRAVLPAPGRRSEEAPHPVPRQRNAPDRGGHGHGGLRRDGVDPVPPPVAVPRDEGRRLRGDQARRVGAGRARAPPLQDVRRRRRRATRSPAGAC